MMAPTMMIKSMITTVTTMMAIVVAPEVDAVEGNHTCGISRKKIHDSTNYM